LIIDKGTNGRQRRKLISYTQLIKLIRCLCMWTWHIHMIDF